MASPYSGNPYSGNPYSGNPYSGNPYSKSNSGINFPATADQVFQKQLASMARTLANGGVNMEPVDNRTWLEKFFNLLNRPLGAVTSTLSAISPDITLGQGVKGAGEVLTGKKTYGTTELLNDTLGKSDTFGRKALAFALGIPLDPLTWIPISKVAKPLLGASAKGIRAAGWGNKLDDAADIASNIKKFFGYDDFRRFGPKAEKTIQTMVDGKMKTIVTQQAQPDMRNAARQIQQLVGSNTARRGVEIDKYMKEIGSVFGDLKMNKVETDQFMKLIENSNDALHKLSKGEKILPNVQKALDSFKATMKKLGDQKAELGLIEDVSGEFTKVGLPKRIGGETSEGYIKHVINQDFKRKYPTLSDVPYELQTAAKPFYEIGSKKIYSRKMPGSILDNNIKSQMFTGGKRDVATGKVTGGMKMFEDNPIEILKKEIEEMAQVKAQKEIVAGIKGLTDSAGKPLIQSFDDKTMEVASKALAATKTKSGRQPFIRSAGTDIEEGMKAWMEKMGINYSDVVKSVPEGMDALTNPLFKQTGKVTAANKEVAAIINKLSEEIPGEAANPLIRNLDKITNMWKKLAITNPKFHVNNWFGANTNNLIDDPVGTIKNAPLVGKILKGGNDKVYEFANGVKGTADEILEGFKKSGAIAGFTKVEAFPKNPVDFVSKASSAVGTKIEEQARMTAYLNAMDRGLSQPEAIQRVFQIHGNYAPEAMSKFEKEVVKRVIPFYTWAKTSAPYQLQSLYNKTGIYSNLAHSQSIIANEEDRKGIPDWLRSRILLGTKKNADGTSTARQLPMSVPDLEMFGDPARVLLSKLNPLLKIPLEVGQNKGTFFGQTLFDKNKYSEEGKKVPMSSQVWDYIASQIPAITAVKSGKKFADEELRSTGIDQNALTFIMAAIAGQLDPTAPKNFDPSRERYAQDKITSEMMQNLISNLRRNGIIPPAK